MADVLERCKSLYVLKGEIAGTILPELFEYADALASQLESDLENTRLYAAAEIEELRADLATSEAARERAETILHNAERGEDVQTDAEDYFEGNCEVCGRTNAIERPDPHCPGCSPWPSKSAEEGK